MTDKQIRKRQAVRQVEEVLLSLEGLKRLREREHGEGFEQRGRDET